MTDITRYRLALMLIIIAALVVLAGGGYAMIHAKSFGAQGAVAVLSSGVLYLLYIATFRVQTWVTKEGSE
jgi:hypothetical protein